MDEEDTPRKIAAHVLGEDLSDLSIDELEERIDSLKMEIDRLAGAILGKRDSADVAATFFKNS